MHKLKSFTTTEKKFVTTITKFSDETLKIARVTSDVSFLRIYDEELGFFDHELAPAYDSRCLTCFFRSLQGNFNSP